MRVSSGSIEVYAEPKSLPAGTACQRDNLMVRQLEIFSHGGLDGPIFGDNRQQFGLSGAPPLSTLPRLPYTGGAILFFRGCRIGAGQFLGTFARQQGGDLRIREDNFIQHPSREFLCVEQRRPCILDRVPRIGDHKPAHW